MSAITQIAAVGTLDQYLNDAPRAYGVVPRMRVPRHAPQACACTPQQAQAWVAARLPSEQAHYAQFVLDPTMEFVPPWASLQSCNGLPPKC